MARPRMTSSGSKSLPAVGFLTVIEHTELGLTGGYLVLNTLGRPLEFHCTAPVKTSRAQEILYGPTLKDFLFGEQIGQTLYEKSQLKPLFVCTDVEPAVSVREVIDAPVALLHAAAGRASDEPAVGRVAAASSTFSLGPYRLSVSPRHPGDQQRITELWQPYADGFDLTEPFERIREAISEARKAA